MEKSMHAKPNELRMPLLHQNEMVDLKRGLYHKCVCAVCAEILEIPLYNCDDTLST